MPGHYTYKRWLIISLSIHVAIILLILIANGIYRISARPVFVAGSLGNAEPISVDVVGLPNILKKDIPLVNKEETPEEEPVEKKAEMTLPDAKQTAEKKKSLISKIKDAVTKEDNYLTKIKIIKGLNVQKGSSVGTSTSGTGIGINSDAVPANPYFGTIKEYIRAYWKVPNWIKKDGLNTLVVVRISDDGNIRELNISKSSGNSEFDELALNSVKNAAPFPKPPVSIKELLDNGIILSFP